MSSKSIVDRVLLFAAAVCTAGLIWQLTVLMTAKGSTPPSRKINVASTTAPPAAESVSPPAGENASAPASVSTVRVVYPDGGSAKMTGKAVDRPDGTPVALASQSVMNGVAAAPTPAVAAPKPPEAAVLPGSAIAPASTLPAIGAPTAVSIQAPPSPASPTPAAAAASPAPAPPAVIATADDTSAMPRVADASDEIVPAPPAKPPEVAASSRPRKLASVAPVASAESSSVRSASSEPKPSAKRGGVNINHASIDALNHLPGAGRIGQAIADHRPYRSIEDLLAKRVVRRSVYEHIKNQLATE